MALLIEIKVIPSSGRQKFVLDKSGIIKCFLKSAPEKGRANVELIDILAKNLKISKGQIEILSGQTSRKKRIKIDQDLTKDSFLEKLGIGE